MFARPGGYLVLTLLALVVFPTAGTAQAPGLLDPGDATTGLYHLDEGDTILHDAGPNGLDGVVQGSAVKQSAPWGRALVCDGTTSSVGLIPDPQARLLPPYSPFTIEAWVRIDNLPGGPPIPVLSRRALPSTPPGAPTSAMELQYIPYPGGWCFKFMDPTGLTMRLYHTFPIQTGRWYHLAVTWDGMVGTLYCDGSSLAVMAFQSFYGYDPASPWVIGGGESGGLLTGAVDEVHFAKDRLLPNQLRTLHTKYGFGKSGGNGIWPTIGQDGGPPATTRTVQIQVGKGYPKAPGILFASPNPGVTVLDGGLFLLDPGQLISFPFFMDQGLGSLPGTARATIGLPPGGSSLLGRSFFFQALAIDPGAKGFYSLTHGLALHYPY